MTRAAGGVDGFDHVTPLCERSLTEALETTGFDVPYDHNSDGTGQMLRSSKANYLSCAMSKTNAAAASATPSWRAWRPSPAMSPTRSSATGAKSSKDVLPLLSKHINLTVELPLKAIVRGYTYTVVPIGWYNRTTGVSKVRSRRWAVGARSSCFMWLEKVFPAETTGGRAV